MSVYLKSDFKAIMFLSLMVVAPAVMRRSVESGLVEYDCSLGICGIACAESVSGGSSVNPR